MLAVSREMGYSALKGVMVAVPEEREYELRGREQTLVLATNGLWDLDIYSEDAAFLRASLAAKGATAIPRDRKEAAEGFS